MASAFTEMEPLLMYKVASLLPMIMELLREMDLIIPIPMATE